MNATKPKRKRWQWVSRAHWERIKNLSPAARRFYWAEHQRIWKPILAAKKARGNARPTLRARERNYVKTLAPQVVYLVAHYADHEYLSDLIRIAAAYSLNTAGYRRTDYVNKEGIPTKRGLKKIEALNSLPRIILAMREELTQHGLSPGRVYTVLNTLLDNGDPEIQLKAIKQWVDIAVPKMTLNKNQNENANMNVPFFTPEILNNPPPMKLDET